MLTWKPRKGQYQTGENAFLGRVAVGAWFYTIHHRGANDPLRYRWEMGLPGFKREYSSGLVATQEEAKAALEAAVRRWVGLADLVKQ
jgi:hypothetical protein